MVNSGQYWDMNHIYHIKHYKTLSGWWCNNHLEKYESQWEGLSMIIAYIMENKKCSKPPIRSVWSKTYWMSFTEVFSGWISSDTEKLQGFETIERPFHPCWHPGESWSHQTKPAGLPVTKHDFATLRTGKSPCQIKTASIIRSKWTIELP